MKKKIKCYENLFSVLLLFSFEHVKKTAVKTKCLQYDKFEIHFVFIIIICSSQSFPERFEKNLKMKGRHGLKR